MAAITSSFMGAAVQAKAVRKAQASKQLAVRADIYPVRRAAARALARAGM